jgi:RES domain-containing protein
VLDLTAGDVRKALAVSDARLIGDEWRKATKHESLTQAIGRLAFEAVFEAIIAPSSAVPGQKNLIVFPSNLVAPDGYVRVVNRSKLPVSASR